eukprot:10011764-Alexandrium_andersonii.AAC.1
MTAELSVLDVLAVPAILQEWLLHLALRVLRGGAEQIAMNALPDFTWPRSSGRSRRSARTAQS